MELFIIGIATAFNLIVLRVKWSNERYADAFLDATILVGLGMVFGGTMGGLTIAMITSMIISLYLLAFPPKFAD